MTFDTRMPSYAIAESEHGHRAPAGREGGGDHEQVVIRHDPETGLRLIVAVHSTALGPALGGMRVRRYAGGMPDALDDVLALARTMTLKAAAAGLDLGGGKAVMLDDGREDLRERRMELAADTIDGLAGAYITAEDIGTTTADMDLIGERTRYVAGRSVERGGRGDPSPVTAETVFRALGKGLAAATGSADPDGRRIGVVGLGKVGYTLAARLVDAGARVVACDLDHDRAERFADECGGAIVPSAEAILSSGLDVLAPCATGGLVDAAIATSIDCSVVAGAANNQLSDLEAARRLANRGIVCVPDFLANCGGLIHVAGEWHGSPRSETERRVCEAMTNLDRALAEAAADGLTPVEVARRQALRRVAGGRPGLARVA